MSDLIERQVHFGVAQQYDPLDKVGKNNTWIYNRAPEGFLFQLVEINVIPKVTANQYHGLFAIFDGHEYTNHDLWPGVQSNEVLYGAVFITEDVQAHGSLHGWECKEYTIGLRSWSETDSFKIRAIVWYHLKKASRDELLEYAMKHPQNQDAFKRALRGRTVDEEELTPHG